MILGTTKADKLAGDEHDNVMAGRGGDDVMFGGSGADIMLGGGGDDFLSGDAGNDTIFGGSSLGGTVDMSKFRIAEDVTAKVTFMGEDAGYQNTLGMYRIAADGTIYGVQILFGNASLKGSGGDLVGGSSSADVKLAAGERIGFFIVPNSFAKADVAKLLAGESGSFKFVGSDGKPANVNGGGELKLVHVSNAGVETIVKSEYGSSVFHSLGADSGLNGDKFSHVTGTVSTVEGSVTIGFEDLWGGGDQDFNDSVLRVDIGLVNAALLAREPSGAAKSTDNDVIMGGTGDDKLFGMAGDDHVDGGDGNDQIWGNSGNDKLFGGAGNDEIRGGSGNDIISDGDGDDLVEGNSGDDVFVAGAGNDTYYGGSGFDTLDFSAAGNGVAVDLHAHTAVGMGSDVVWGVEKVIGSAFADTFKGDKNDNVFEGGAGDDTFRGLGGADIFTGGEGKDTYLWYAKDVVDPVSGAHLGVDHITDFSKEDRLNFHELLKGQKFGSVEEVVKVSDGKAGATVSVKIGDAFVDVVVLDGLHGLSAHDLHANGLILA